MSFCVRLVCAFLIVAYPIGMVAAGLTGRRALSLASCALAALSMAVLFG